MVYGLIIVMATGVTTVGTYSDWNNCNTHAQQFQKQNVTAACVVQQEQTPEQKYAQAQVMIQKFMSDFQTMIEKADKR